jgi:hypothetical protein
MRGLTAALGVDDGQGRSVSIDIVRLRQLQGRIGQRHLHLCGGDQIVGLRKAPSAPRDLFSCLGLDGLQVQPRLLEAGALDLQVGKEGVVEKRDLDPTSNIFSRYRLERRSSRL